MLIFGNDRTLAVLAVAANNFHRLKMLAIRFASQNQLLLAVFVRSS